jgi:uncharacterized protein YneR
LINRPLVRVWEKEETMRVNTIINTMVNTDNISINLLCKNGGMVDLDNDFYGGTIQDMPKEYGGLKVVNITTTYVDAEETYSILELTVIDDRGVVSDSWVVESDTEDEDWD